MQHVLGRVSADPYGVSTQIFYVCDDIIGFGLRKLFLLLVDIINISCWTSYTRFTGRGCLYSLHLIYRARLDDNRSYVVYTMFVIGIKNNHLNVVFNY